MIEKTQLISSTLQYPFLSLHLNNYNSRFLYW